MCSIEGETRNFVLKFREIFLWRETLLRAHGMKSDEKPFFAIFWGKMVHFVIDRYFSLFLKGLEIFLNLRISLSVPLRYKVILLLLLLSLFISVQGVMTSQKDVPRMESAFATQADTSTSTSANSSDSLFYTAKDCDDIKNQGYTKNGI